MDCKENSSHLAFCEANLFHPRSLSMGISIGNCCGSNGNGDTNGVIVSSLQGAGGTNLSISNKEDVTVTGQERGGGGGQVKKDEYESTRLGAKDFEGSPVDTDSKLVEDLERGELGSENGSFDSLGYVNIVSLTLEIFLKFVQRIILKPFMRGVNFFYC